MPFCYGGDGDNRSYASAVATQPSHLYVPFADAKDGLCGFDYRINKTRTNYIGSSFIGGDGGNRNRVRKSIPATFYERSLSFEIPLRERRQTGSLLRYPLDHDELQG